MSAETERARALLDNARAQLDREAGLLEVVGALTDQLRDLWREIAELHDADLSIANRIESVSRASRAARDDLLAHETNTTHAHRA